MSLPYGSAVVVGMRYDMRPDPVGWTIIDVTTGRPVLLHDTVLVGIDLEEADRLVDLLNAHDLHRQRAASAEGAGRRGP